MEKKNNVGLVVIIVLLVLVILGLFGFIMYDKGIIFNNNEENKNEVSTDVEENKNNEEYIDIALDDSRFINIYNKLYAYTYKSNREKGFESFTDIELGIIGITDSQDDDFTATEGSSIYGPYYTFKGDTLINNLKKYFDENVTLDKNVLIDKPIVLPNIDGVKFNGSGMIIDSYNNNNDTYKVSFSGIGGTTGPQPVINERKITSAKIKDNTIIVEEKAIYYEVANYNYSIYSDPSSLNHLENKLFDPETMHGELLITIDNYLNQASTITHTYKLNESTGNYYFVSSIIK